MSARYAFPKALKELRFLFSQTGEASVPVRSFLNKEYPAIKQHNPTTPVLVREAFGIPPQVFARFEHGKEAKLSLEGVSEKDLENALNKFVNQA